MAIFNSKLAADSINAISVVENTSHTLITVVLKNYNVPLHTNLRTPIDGEIILRCQPSGTNIAPGIYLIISRPALISGVPTVLNNPNSAGPNNGILGTPYVVFPPGWLPTSQFDTGGMLDDYLRSFLGVNDKNNTIITLKNFERFIAANTANNTGRIYQITGADNLINTDIPIRNDLLQLITPAYITQQALPNLPNLNQGRTSFEIYVSALWNYLSFIDSGNSNNYNWYNKTRSNRGNSFSNFLNISGFHFDYVFNNSTPIFIQTKNNPYNPSYSTISSTILFYTPNGASITFNNIINNATPPRTNLNMQLSLSIDDKYFFNSHELILAFIYLKQIVIDLFISQTNRNGANQLNFADSAERTYFQNTFLRYRAFKIANILGHVLIKNYMQNERSNAGFNKMLNDLFYTLTTTYNNNVNRNNRILGLTGLGVQ